MKYKTIENLTNMLLVPELVIKHLNNKELCKKLINAFRYDIKNEIFELKYNVDKRQKYYNGNYAEDTKELIRDLLDDKNELTKYYNEKYR